MQKSFPVVAEKRSREEISTNESSPKTPKLEVLPPAGVDREAYQKMYSLIEDGSIVVADTFDFNRLLKKVAPSAEQRLANEAPRNTIWGKVDFDVQLDILKAIVDETITVNNESNLIRVMEESAPLKKTPEKLPPTPSAPQKPEILDAPPRIEDEDSRVKRRLDMGAEDEDDALDEDVVTKLDLINANTIDVYQEYDENEPNPITRAFCAAIDALVGGTDSRDYKNALELVARSLIGVGTLEQYSERLHETCGEELELVLY